MKFHTVATPWENVRTGDVIANEHTTWLVTNVEEYPTDVPLAALVISATDGNEETRWPVHPGLNAPVLRPMEGSG